MHFGGIDDDRKDATALHITFRPQLSEHRQCGLSICTFHIGFSLVRYFMPTDCPGAAAEDGWRRRPGPGPLVDLAITGVMADGGLRRSESAALTWGDVDYYQDGTARITIQKGKNQPEPLIVAVTETTARALRDIQPNGADPAAPVFGLTGEALANRIRAAARAAGRGEDFSGHSGRIGADRGGPAPRAVEARRHGRPLHSGRGRRRGAEVADLGLVTE